MLSSPKVDSLKPRSTDLDQMKNERHPDARPDDQIPTGSSTGANDSPRQQLKNKWTNDYTDTRFGKSNFSNMSEFDKGRATSLNGAMDEDASTGLYQSMELDDLLQSARDTSASGIDRSASPADAPAVMPYRKMMKDRKKPALPGSDTMDVLERLPSGGLVDWVPSPVDPTDNGGFGAAPDNGFPVPYTLNGWVEIQRKYPWEAGQ